MNLSFYTPIAYDYKYSLIAILSYYSIADEIILGIDSQRISWSCKRYDFDEKYFDEIKKIDINNKIKIIEGNFHSTTSPIENDTSERNYLTTLCKKDNYIIGIDSDEFVLNPEVFLNWFNQNQPQLDILCRMSSVYKIVDNKILICQPSEKGQIGTSWINRYKKCRITRNKTVNSPLEILHFSWGRTKEELICKLKNFGHSKDFDIESYMKIWDDVTLENFSMKKDLHPLKCKNLWLSLKLLDMSELQKDIYDKLICLNVFTKDAV